MADGLAHWVEKVGDTQQFCYETGYNEALFITKLYNIDKYNCINRDVV